MSGKTVEPQEKEAVLLQVAGPVATLRLTRPAITLTMAAQLLQHLADLNSSKFDAVRVIVLTGTGRFFCTGMDLTVKPSQPGAAAGGVGESAAKAGSVKPYAFFEAIWASPKPVVAVMNGPALGGGVGLLYACDVRVALKGSYIKFPEAALGVFPALISGYIAPQLGPYLTQYYMLTGESMSAEQLLAHGQISAVAETPEALSTEVKRVIQQLLQAPKASHAGVKRIVRLVCYQGEYHQEAMDGLLSEFGPMMRSPEARHGMKTFREEKRTPDWEAFYKQAASSNGKPGPQKKSKL